MDCHFEEPRKLKPNETVLRAGSLELDLIDRTAKRSDRPIDLRPRKFHLFKYMMQRSDLLQTRAALFDDVSHYKFVMKPTLSSFIWSTASPWGVAHACAKRDGEQGMLTKRTHASPRGGENVQQLPTSSAWHSEAVRHL